MSEGAIVQGEGVEVPLQVSEGADQPAVVGAAVAVIHLPLSEIGVFIDEVQVRKMGLQEYRVEGMVSVLDAGGDLPAIEVHEDSGNKFLVDGFHRYEAYTRAGRQTIPVELRMNSTGRAIRLAAGAANLKHGLPLSNDDKWFLYVSLWDVNPTLGEMIEAGYQFILPPKIGPDTTWQKAPSGIKRAALGLAKSTHHDWLDRLTKIIGSRPAVVQGVDGREYKTTNIANAAEARATLEAESRLRRKIKLAVDNKKLDPYIAANCKISEVTTNRNDLRLTYTDPRSKEDRQIDGRWERPADRVQREKHEIEAAEKSIVERPEVADPITPAPKYGPDWKPEGTPIKSAAVGTAPEVAGYTVGLCADLSRTLMYFQANWGQLQLVQSIRSIRDTMPGQVDGLRQKLAEVLVLLDEGNVMLMREHVEDLIGQLDGGGE